MNKIDLYILFHVKADILTVNHHLLRQRPNVPHPLMNKIDLYILFHVKAEILTVNHHLSRQRPNVPYPLPALCLEYALVSTMHQFNAI